MSTDKIERDNRIIELLEELNELLYGRFLKDIATSNFGTKTSYIFEDLDGITIQKTKFGEIKILYQEFKSIGGMK